MDIATASIIRLVFRGYGWSGKQCHRVSVFGSEGALGVIPARKGRDTLALYFAFYDFCRVHTSLTVGDKAEGEKVTRKMPAMKTGLTDHVWSVKELLEMIGSN